MGKQSILTPTLHTADVLLPDEVLQQQKPCDDVLPPLCNRAEKSSRSPASRMVGKKQLPQQQQIRSSRATMVQTADSIPYNDEEREYDSSSSFEDRETEGLPEKYEPQVQMPYRSQVTTPRTTDDFPPPLQSWWEGLKMVRERCVFWAKVVGIVLAVGGITYFEINTYFWVGDQWNTYHYGPTRTNHITAVLGMDHDSTSSPTDITVSNIRGAIITTVLPAGDTSKALIYALPYHLYGDNISKTPVWATVQGKNIVIHIDGQSTTATLVNAGDHFESAK